MGHTGPLSATQEDYLETIFKLVAERRVARAGAIAEALSVHKSTVTSALRGLAGRGLINYSPYALITLTPAGERLAREIRRRHQVIRRFLEEVLMVEPEVAEANACRMEHVLDGAVLERLARFAEFARRCPRAGEDWLRRFDYYCKHGGRPASSAQLRKWLAGLQRRVLESGKRSPGRAGPKEAR